MHHCVRSKGEILHVFCLQLIHSWLPRQCSNSYSTHIACNLEIRVISEHVKEEDQKLTQDVREHSLYPGDIDMNPSTVWSQIYSDKNLYGPQTKERGKRKKVNDQQ